MRLFKKMICLCFWAVLGLHCRVGFPLAAGSGSSPPAAAREQPRARGTLLGQGLNLRPLHWAGVSFTTEPPRQPGVRLLKAEMHEG